MAQDTSTVNRSEVVSSPADSYKNSNGYSIVLENERVAISKEQKEVGSVLLEDILGVHQVTHDKGDGVKLVVHGFPKTKRIFRSEARSLMKLVMHFDSDNASEEWKKKIILQSRKVIQEKYGWYQGEFTSCVNFRDSSNFVKHKFSRSLQIHLFHDCSIREN